MADYVKLSLGTLQEMLEAYGGGPKLRNALLELIEKREAEAQAKIVAESLRMDELAEVELDPFESRFA